ncbi:MAG: leucine-rich repeat domain-containing protein [Ruminococcaceae bacterium]|nr:leucine-rich repeat domain-containing protein [Oscillospiraceae bacterium]
MKNNDFFIEDGILKKYKGSDENVIIPDGVVEIDGSFKEHKLFPERIWVGAFEYSANLLSVKIPVGVERIKKQAFAECKNLTTVNLPYSLVSIEDNAFKNCLNLEKINIPDSVCYIGQYAFVRCDGLKEIILPDTITEFKGSIIEDVWNNFFGIWSYHEQSEIAILFSLLKYASKSVLKDKSVQEELNRSKWKVVKHAITNDDPEALKKILGFYKVTKSQELSDYLEFAKNSPNVKAALLDYQNNIVSKKSKDKEKHKIDEEYVL